MSNRVAHTAHTTCATVDRFCVINLIFHYRTEILKLRHAHTCASIDIKSFYISIVIVSFILIYWYVYRYILHIPIIVILSAYRIRPKGSQRRLSLFKGILLEIASIFKIHQQLAHHNFVLHSTSIIQ